MPAQSPPWRRICSAMPVWQPAASRVTMQPERSRSASRRGMAAISPSPCVVATCPSATPLSVAHAHPTSVGWNTTLITESPASWARRSRLPSMATTCPSVFSNASAAQAANERSKCVRSTRANTRESVSCDGTPPASGMTRRSQSIWACPKASTATKVSAPLVTAQRVRAKMSASAWRRRCSRRGSGTSSKCPPRRDKSVEESRIRSYAAQSDAIALGSCCATRFSESSSLRSRRSCLISWSRR